MQCHRTILSSAEQHSLIEQHPEKSSPPTPDTHTVHTATQEHSMVQIPCGLPLIYRLLFKIVSFLLTITTVPGPRHCLLPISSRIGSNHSAGESWSQCFMLHVNHVHYHQDHLYHLHESCPFHDKVKLGHTFHSSRSLPPIACKILCMFCEGLRHVTLIV